MNTQTISTIQALVAAYDGTGRIRDIMALVEGAFGITHEGLMSRSRLRKLVRPRQVAMWLCRCMTPCSLQQIGRVFDRDHTTVVAAIQRVDALIAAEPAFAVRVMGLRNAITSREAVA